MGTRSFSFPDKRIQSGIEHKLRSLPGAQEVVEKNCLYRLDFDLGKKKKIVVKQYHTGTIVLSGREDSSLFTKLAGIIARGDAFAPAQAGDFEQPWVGVDEAGKGDYFGPLVVAAVFLNAAALPFIREAGVRDSKLLSDTKVLEIAEKLETRFGKSIEVLELSPIQYNKLINSFRDEGKTLNDLLAWAASTAIKNMRKRKPFSRVVVDKFARESYLDRRLSREKGLDVKQIPRGEADPAVAAASIMARARFLTRLADLGKCFGLKLPKGAASVTVEAGRRFIEKHGRERLPEVAKIHFKTTASL